MTTFRAVLGASLAVAVLASCGQVPGARQVQAGSIVAQELDIPLNEAPKTAFVVPHAPVHAPNPVATGNYATLNVFPTETLPALKALINGAQKSLYFETFNFGNDYSYRTGGYAENSKIVVCQRVDGRWAHTQGTPPASYPDPCAYVVDTCAGTTATCDVLERAD